MAGNGEVVGKSETLYASDVSRRSPGVLRLSLVVAIIDSVVGAALTIASTGGELDLRWQETIVLWAMLLAFWFFVGWFVTCIPVWIVVEFLQDREQRAPKKGRTV